MLVVITTLWAIIRLQGKRFVSGGPEWLGGMAHERVTGSYIIHSQPQLARSWEDDEENTVDLTLGARPPVASETWTRDKGSFIRLILTISFVSESDLRHRFLLLLLLPPPHRCFLTRSDGKTHIGACNQDSIDNYTCKEDLKRRRTTWTTH